MGRLTARKYPVKLPPRKKKKAKRLEIEAAAISKGTELGKAQAHRKKPLLDSAKEHIDHWIDSIDPLELAAVIGTTIIVHRVIVETTSIIDYIKRKAEVSRTIPLLPMFTRAIVKVGGDYIGDTSEFTGLDWELWLQSFALAYIIVHHAGQLIGLLESGLTKAIPFLLGMP